MAGGSLRLYELRMNRRQRSAGSFICDSQKPQLLTTNFRSTFEVYDAAAIHQEIGTSILKVIRAPDSKSLFRPGELLLKGSEVFPLLFQGLAIWT